MKSAGHSLSLTSVLQSKIVLFLLLLPVVVRVWKGTLIAVLPRPGSAHVGELANVALSRIVSVNWIESLTKLPDSWPFSALELVNADRYFLSFV